MGRFFIAVCLIGIVLAPKVLRAQNTPFQSASLDPDCYFPNIGVPDEIDSIYGGATEERLGAMVHNLGPKADGSFGEMLIATNARVGGFNMHCPIEFQTGPEFNLRSSSRQAQQLLLDPTHLRFGHFHNGSSVDIFDEHRWRIYWADDSGRYDSTRVTQLVTTFPGSYSTDFLSQGYLAHLTSDTIDDLLLAFETTDSIYLALFKGGSNLYGRSTAPLDSFILLPQPYLYGYRYAMQGDFRGTGRDDLIIADYSRNLFFYKNEPPFTLEKFVHSMYYDTLWTHPPRFKDSLPLTGRIYWINPFNSLAMHALPKPKGDRSVDWVVWIPTKDSGDVISFFRGGPNFGSHRITMDSAAYVIHQPVDLDFETRWPDFMSDAGDLTGTGNHVLYVASDNGSYAYQNFYLTGQALDNKIDIFNSFDAGALVDTLTANDDSLEDLMLGLPGHVSPEDQSNGKQSVGSIWVMYGSKQIPVHLNPQFAYVKTDFQRGTGALSFWPNPTTRSWAIATAQWTEAEEAELEVYDMLGNLRQRETMRMLGGVEQQRVYFRGLQDGVYEVTLRGHAHAARTRVVIAR